MASQSNTITVAGCIMAVAFAVRRLAQPSRAPHNLRTISTPSPHDLRIIIKRCGPAAPHLIPVLKTPAWNRFCSKPLEPPAARPRTTLSSRQSLLFSSTAVLNQFGFVLVVATLVDTFVVRALLVPALMFIAVEWNWWPGKVPPVAIRLG